MENKITKTSETHKTITFAILVPDEVDLNGDMIPKDEIVKTAHNFVETLDLKKVNVDHKDGTDIPTVKIVESYILPMDMPIDWEIIPEGSWMVALKFEDDKLYQDVLNWDYVWVSMEGKRYDWDVPA